MSERASWPLLEWCFWVCVGEVRGTSANYGPTSLSLLASRYFAFEALHLCTTEHGALHKAEGSTALWGRRMPVAHRDNAAKAAAEATWMHMLLG